MTGEKKTPPALVRKLAVLLAPFLNIGSRIFGARYFDHVEFVQFCCVGLANTLVDFCVYLPASFVLPLPAARVASWAVACAFSYCGNKTWVFQAKSKGPGSLIRFVTVNALGLALGLLAMKLFVYLGWGRIIAYAVTLPAIALGNYFGYKLWSFKDG